MPLRDVEGGMARRPSSKARRRPVWALLPVRIALGMLCIFLFFSALNLLGRRRQPAAGEAAAAQEQQQQQQQQQQAAAAVADQPPDQPPPQQGPAPRRVPDALGAPSLFRLHVVAEHAHDPAAFTQGLEYERVCAAGAGAAGGCADVLWESTGLNGRSTVRRVDLASGRVLASEALPADDFGEGLTRLGGRLYQLTWRSPRLWSYAAADLADKRARATPLSDGWGLANNGSHLIASDSSARLTWLDPGTLAAARAVDVHDGGAPVPWLNELEWVDGVLWANVYQTECIAQIDPGTGAVVGWVDAAGLRARAVAANPKPAEQPDVLNGIAWDSARARLWVTGKLWPRLYQVELRPWVDGGGGAAAGGLSKEALAEARAAKLAEMRARCIVAGDGALGR